MSTNFWKGDKAQFLLNKLAFLDKKEILSLNTDPSLTATDAPTDSFGLFGASIWVKLDDGSTTNWKSLDDKMKWRGDWAVGEYIKNDTVRDLEWTMIANKTTEERAAPVPTGDPVDVFTGDMDSEQVTAKQVIYGQRYSNTQGVFINSYRVNTVAGNIYRVFSVKDPLGTPIITELVSFEATSSAWSKFNISPVLLRAGSIFDLVVVGTEPNPTPTTFDGAWTYSKPSNDSAPLTGEIVQSSKDSNLINVNKTDNVAGDRSTELQALAIGDQISMDGANWSIQSVADNTTYMTYSVAPASQSALSGVQTFTFETVTATPLTYGTKADHWVANANISGLYVADDSYANIVANDNAYSVDINVTEADISEDWDVVASGSTAGSANPIVPFTVTETVEYLGYTSINGSGFMLLPDERTNTSGDVITVTNTDHTRYTFNREADFTAVAGYNLTPDALVLVDLFNSSDVLLKRGYETAGAAGTATATMVGKASIGDYIVYSTTTASSDSNSTNFSITATAQSSGTVFATDSNKEDSMIRLTGGAGHGSTNTKIRNFATEQDNVGSAIAYELSATLGASFTINETGVYSISYSDEGSTTSWHMGLSLNSTQLTTDVQSISASSRLAKEFTPSGTTAAASVSWTGKLSKNDVLRAHTNGTASSNTLTTFTITKQSVNVDNLIIENFGTVVAASTLGTGELENVFSARIANNGTASITSQSSPFIQSVTRSGLGTVQVTFVSGFFTVPPSIAMIAESAVFLSANNPVVTTTGFGYNSANDIGSPLDIDAAFIVQRQGIDYKSKANYIDSLIIENPDGEFETVEYILPATTISQDIIMSMDGESSYSVTGNVYFDSTDSQVTVTSEPSGSIVGYLRSRDGNDTGVAISLNIPASGDTSIKFHLNRSGTGQGIVGSGTKQHTFFQLTKLPKQLGVVTVEGTGGGVTVVPLVTTETSEAAYQTSFWDNTGAVDSFDESLVSNNDNSVYSIETVSGQTRIIAKKDIDLVVNFNAQLAGGSSINIVHSTLGILGVDQVNSGISIVNTSIPLSLQAGEYIYCDIGNNNSILGGMSITATALSEGTAVASETTDADLENVFSAKITNNGTATVTHENQNFIQSVNRYATGRVTVTFVPDFFTIAPAVTAMTNLPSVQGNFTEVSSVSTTGFVFYTAGHTGTSYDENVSVVVSRVGTDYKSKANFIDNLIIENPEGEFETTTKYLTSSISTDIVATDLTFDNLIIGENYEINLLGYISSKNTAGSYVFINHDGQIIGTHRAGNRVAGNQIYANSSIVKFTASATTLTFNTSSFTGTGSLLIGNGTAENTFAQLTKLPKKLGVDQLGQVVTNHVTGGTEYELKGQLWNGKQIYAVSYETASDFNSDTLMFLLDTTYTPIDAQKVSSSWYAFSAGILSNSGADTAYPYFDKPAGEVRFYASGRTVFAGTTFTLKYTKP